MKKNNKGFSLVELIVVILIMAILGVALTPQVMKWVNNSRLSSDITNYDALVSAVQITLTNETVYSEVTEVTGVNTTAITINLAKDAELTVTDNAGKNQSQDPSLAKDFYDVLIANLPDYQQLQMKTPETGSPYTIVVKNNGTIVRDTTLEGKKAAMQ